MAFASKIAAKKEAQDVLLDGVSYAMSYWQDQHPKLAASMTMAERVAFRALLQEQADRVAKLFGYDGAWSV